MPSKNEAQVAGSKQGTGISTHHPLYNAYQSDWILLRDCYEGEQTVKSKGTLYLPATSGMIIDGVENTNSIGYQAYQSYKNRAYFPSVVADAVRAMIGVMHHKKADISLPKELEPLRKRATTENESLDMLLRRINEEQLITGRAGLLLDMPPKNEARDSGMVTPEQKLYLALYSAERMINWDRLPREMQMRDDLMLVVLNESEYERENDLTWTFVNKYRVLKIDKAMTYKAHVFRQDHQIYSETKLVAPSVRGKTLDKIPFVFINAKDIVINPDEPPLKGLANLAMAIYRLEADYRQALYLQGQDTLVVKGAKDDQQFRVGAGASINLPETGDALFIGVSSEGLSEMRNALENDRTNAMQQGGHMLDNVSRERESGEALHVRVAARAATLNHVAMAGAGGLEKILKIAAEWVGANPDEVKVEPNLDFVDDRASGQDLLQFVSAMNMGLPLSPESLHKYLKDKGMTELDFEEEMKLIENSDFMGLGVRENENEQQ